MVLVIRIEERRKRPLQMLTHHFVTIALLAGSYAYHQTRVGNLILILMDVIDLFLPVYWHCALGSVEESDAANKTTARKMSQVPRRHRHLRRNIRRFHHLVGTRSTRLVHGDALEHLHRLS
jgi:hypothetical protein